jgi:hypothetical protein
MASNRIVYNITVPTPASVLAGALDLPWVQYAGLLALPVGLLIWWRWRKDRPVDMVQLAVTAAIASLLTTAYGWSFDFILFLAPIHQLAVWAVEARLTRTMSVIGGLLLFAANVLFFYQRSLHLQDKALVWFPILLALLYALLWWSAAARRPAVGVE